jgi:vitamin B12 transporter
VSLDAYWLINAAVSYKLQPGVELFGRVENLLDRDYQEVFGFEAAPIAAFAGVKFIFGGPEGYGGSWAR